MRLFGFHTWVTIIRSFEFLFSSHWCLAVSHPVHCPYSYFFFPFTSQTPFSAFLCIGTLFQFTSNEGFNYWTARLCQGVSAPTTRDDDTFTAVIIQINNPLLQHALLDYAWDCHEQVEFFRSSLCDGICCTGYLLGISTCVKEGE